MPRLFAGLELSPEIRHQLSGLQQPLPSTRWIEPENLHLTLRFVGDISAPQAREFTANLSAIAFHPFQLTISGLDTFGGNDPRVLLASLTSSEPLAALSRATETAARNAGLPPESRRFVPHVTLARMQSPQTAPLARYLSQHGSLQCGPFTITEFALFSAKPLIGGGPYVIEQTFPSSLGNYDNLWTDEDEAHYTTDSQETEWPKS